MISIETERSLANLFMIISESEKQCEIVRQVLADQPEFEPVSVFQCLDSLNEGYITSSDLLQFMRRNRIIVDENECYMILREWNSTMDGRLSFKDFRTMVLPHTSALLRQKALERPAISRRYMPYEVEYATSRVLERELVYVRTVEIARKNMNRKPDFSLMDGFKVLDLYCLGYVTDEIMQKFLARNGITAYAEDIQAIMRRLDKDQDGKVNYPEYVDAVLSSEPSQKISKLEQDLDERYKRALSPSPYKPSSPNLISRSTASPLKRSSPSSFSRSQQAFSHGDVYRTPDKFTGSKCSPERLGSSLANWDTRNSLKSSARSPLRRSTKNSPKSSKKSPKIRSNVSPSHSAIISSRGSLRSSKVSSPLRRSNSSFKTTRSPKHKTDSISPAKSLRSSGSIRKVTAQESVRQEELSELVNAFKEQISLDRELESIRQELSLRADFTLMDAFKMIDESGKGYIASYDIEGILNYLSIPLYPDNVYLLIKHYDRDQDGKITFSDLCEMFTPRQREYSSLLNARFPANVSSTKRRKVFSIETQDKFSIALKLHLDIEGVSELIRQRLSSRPWFNTFDLFDAIDVDKNGFITLNEFRGILQKYGMFATEKELNALMQRYDRNKDGKVSYSEFVEEVTPKSPTRRLVYN
jgi:Ca2+-binding EF-hand superfamily protein